MQLLSGLLGLSYWPEQMVTALQLRFFPFSTSVINVLFILKNWERSISSSKNEVYACQALLKQAHPCSLLTFYQPFLTRADTDISETCPQLLETGLGHPKAKDLDRFINSAKQLAGLKQPGEQYEQDIQPDTTS